MKISNNLLASGNCIANPVEITLLISMLFTPFILKISSTSEQFSSNSQLNLVLSYFKVTNRDSISESEYRKLKNSICKKIEDSSLKRKYNLVLSNDDNLILFAKHNNEMLDCNEVEKTVSIKNDIKFIIRRTVCSIIKLK